MPAKEVTLVLQVAGTVEQFADIKLSVEANLRQELQCFLPACLLTVTATAGSVTTIAVAAIPVAITTVNVAVATEPFATTVFATTAFAHAAAALTEIQRATRSIVAWPLTLASSSAVG